MNPDKAYGQGMLLVFAIAPIMLGGIVAFGFLLHWIFETFNLPSWILIFFM